MAAPTIVTSSSGIGTAITYPTGLAVGDTLVVFFAERATASGKYLNATFTDGNNRLFNLLTPPSSLPVSLQTGLYYRIVDGTEATGATLSDDGSTSQTWAWLCLRIAGAGTGPIHQTAFAGQSGTIFNFPSVTTTVSDTLVVLFGATATPTAALDTSAVTGMTRDKFGRSATVLGVVDFSAAQAVAGATGAKVTTGAVASANSQQQMYTVAFGISVKARALALMAA